MRNEAVNIANLLSDLSGQDYNAFEVIIVDDHSEDSSKSIAATWLKENGVEEDFIRLLSNDDSGKKSALALGIKAANGEFVMTTDVDCRLPESWISKTIAQAGNQTQLIVGAVRMKGEKFVDHLQQLEFASLIGSGAATLGWQLPTMANGANLTFRKSAFEAVDGYADNKLIASGDDEFLMRKIHARFPGSVIFNHSQHTVVETSTHNSLPAFLNQRIRWASKWALHKTYTSTLLALLIFVFQLTFLLSPWLMLLGYISLKLGIALLILKAGAEWLFFIPVLRQLKQSFNLLAFTVLQFIYPYYVVGIGLLANVMGYRWKGRRYKSSKSPY